MHRRGRIVVTVAAVAAAMLGGGAAGGGTVAAATGRGAEAGGPVTRSVVTLRDQLDGLAGPARIARTRAEQDDLLAGLSGPVPAHLSHLTLANTVIADLTAGQRARLVRDPRVAAVEPDVPEAPAAAAAVASTQRAAPRPATASARSAAPPAVSPSVCTGDADRPQLEPEALGLLRVKSDEAAVATAAADGADGAGVRVGIVTTSIDPRNENFRRPDGTFAVTDYRTFDTAGPGAVDDHSTEGFGDVSSIGGQGTVHYDVADYVDPAAVTLPDGHCRIRIEGVAPRADLVVVDSNGADEGESLGALVQGIDYAVTVGHVDVLSESFGDSATPDYSTRTAVAAANRAAVAAGVTVVAGTGDAGGNSTIALPASSAGVLAVGATDAARLAQQIDQQGQTLLGNGRWTSDTVAALSSAGFTQGARTVDVVAPGDAGWSSCTPAARYADCLDARGRPSNLVSFAGTSEATPFVAGIAALVVQAYRGAHGGSSPTPDLVKRIVAGTAVDLGLPADQQGNGLVDALAAVRAARGVDAAPATGAGTPAVTGAAGTSVAAVTVSGGTLVPDVTQLSATGGDTARLHLSAINTGAAPVPAGTAVLTRDEVGRTVSYPVRVDSGDPVLIDGASATALAYVRQQVPVAAGTQWLQLRLQAFFDDADAPAASGLLVLAPDGTVAARVQSLSGLGAQVQVPHPVAGTWTVVVEGLPGSPLRGTLQARFGVRTELARVPVAAAVAPGGTVVVDLAAPVPATSGDTAATLRVAGLAVPVVLRRLLDLRSGAAIATGTLRPGIGRSGSPSATATYQTDVAAGTPALTVSVALAAPGSAALTAVLVDPAGTVQSVADNAGSTPPAGGLTGTVADPAPGRWTVVVGVADEAIRAPAVDVAFRVVLATRAVASISAGLDGGTVPAGHSRTATVTVRNPGTAPMTVVVDPRRDTWQTVALTPFTASSVPLPAAGANVDFLTPRFTSQVRITGHTTVAATLFARWITLTSRSSAPGTDQEITLTGPDLDAGFFFVDFGAPAPLGPRGMPTGTATVAATALTRTFDPSVTTAAGQALVGPTGALVAAPVVVPAGGTADIPVSLHADAGVGASVAGFLAVETAARPATGTPRDVLAVFPYRFTVAAVAPPAPVTTPSKTTPPAPVSPAPTTTAPATTTVTSTSTSTSTAGPAGSPGSGPSSTPPTGGAGVPVGRADPGLAATGSDLRDMTAAALVLLAAGVLLLRSSRRRRPRRWRPGVR